MRNGVFAGSRRKEGRKEGRKGVRKEERKRSGDRYRNTHPFIHPSIHSFIHLFMGGERRDLITIVTIREREREVIDSAIGPVGTSWGDRYCLLCVEAGESEEE
jgi:hypothetical protein